MATKRINVFKAVMSSNVSALTLNVLTMLRCMPAGESDQVLDFAISADTQNLLETSDSELAKALTGTEADSQLIPVCLELNALVQIFSMAPLARSFGHLRPELVQQYLSDGDIN